MLAEPIALRVARPSTRTRSGPSVEICSAGARGEASPHADIAAEKPARLLNNVGFPVTAVQAKHADRDVSTAFWDVSNVPKRPRPSGSLRGALPYFPDRLAEVPGLQRRFHLLDAGSAREISAQLWRRDIPEPQEFMDLSETTSEDGSRLLASIGVPLHSPVWLSYASEPKIVLAMDWTTFAKHWDDFWYPSSDDVRVATKENQGWIVEISHEEELRVIRRPV